MNVDKFFPAGFTALSEKFRHAQEDFLLILNLIFILLIISLL